MTVPLPTTGVVPATSAVPQVFSFVDAEHAREWEVRAIRDPVLPQRRARFLNPAYAEGWLLFTSGVERRRYAPLPPNWPVSDEKQLREWWANATLVSADSSRRDAP
jgi:hypothetical protein